MGTLIKLLLCVVVLAGLLIWWLRNALPGNGGDAAEQGRRIHIGKSPPHPWRRKSDRRRK